MSQETPKIVTERRGHVLLITINRIDARNAFDHETALGMEAAIDLLDSDPELRVGIISGAGKHFCAGADLKGVAQGLKPVGERRGGFGIFERPSLKPVIAAVDGYAVGGGFELCLACDLVVATRAARFGLPEVRHNVVAVGGALFRLQKRIPYNVATELALTGRFVDAELLHGYGFVNRLAEQGKAVDAALELAEEILVNGPTAISATREIIFQSASWTDVAAWSNQRPIASRALESEDAKEGLRAFAEKRKPEWKGR
ncbi:crotonase/enoyl-CoA hydratase family protein [Ferrovibrio sp.]|uniref:crotonase/enoyl-CoA hydratase family protein n=1 Tax=Ferrovibrio sp. TaxID=1917215 RepID=UPI003D0E7B08